MKVSDGNHVTSNQKVKVKIKMCDDNRDTFIATLHNLILAPDICDRSFLIMTLISLGHNYLFQKGFLMVYLGEKEKKSVTLPHSA